jgi:hypothetical protein
MTPGREKTDEKGQEEKEVVAEGNQRKRCA